MPGIHQAEAVARAGFEGCLIDLQHGLNGYRDMVEMIMAVNRAGKPAFVRPPLGDNGMVSRALDAGAAVIISPMINSVEDAKALVASAKYPPVGERSWGPIQALPASGLNAADYLQQANDMAMVFAMIETQAAIDAIDDICAVPGLDGVFVGPYDMSISLSGGAFADADSEAVTRALPKIVTSANKAGKLAGIYASTPEQVERFAGLGFRFIAGASDYSILAVGVEALAGSGAAGGAKRDLP